MAEVKSVPERKVLVRRLQTKYSSFSDTLSDTSILAVVNMGWSPNEESNSRELPLILIKRSSDLSSQKYGGGGSHSFFLLLTRENSVETYTLSSFLVFTFLMECKDCLEICLLRALISLYLAEPRPAPF